MLSLEWHIQRKIGAIYTEWQGQLVGIGPGGFEVILELPTRKDNQGWGFVSPALTLQQI